MQCDKSARRPGKLRTAVAVGNEPRDTRAACWAEAPKAARKQKPAGNRSDEGIGQSRG